MTIETCLEDIANYLSFWGYGTPGVDIHIVGGYDYAGNCISITPYGGFEYNSIVSQTVNPYNLNIQILVRNSDNELAYKQSIAIFKLFRDVANRKIGQTKFMSIVARTPPMFVVKTNDGYYHYSTNFYMMIQ